MSSLNDVSGMPTSGANLVIVANVKGVLYLRIFNADGKVVLDTDQTRLTMQAGPIEALKRQLDSSRPPHELTRSEKYKIVTALTSIFRPSLSDFLRAIAARLDYPQGIGQLYLILDQFQGCLYQEDAGVEKDEFLRAFAKVVNIPEVPVHFLVALQSSDLGRLQQLEGLIRRLWDRRYELKNLDKKAARRAILRPIKVFNSKRSVDQASVTLEPGISFVKQLLKDLNEQSQDRSGPSLGVEDRGALPATGDAAALGGRGDTSAVARPP